jgi:translation initiation factor 3 subunit B
MDNCVLVDSIPVVGSDKFDKLISFVKGKFAPSGKILDIVMPKDETSGLTLGYLFIQFSTKEEALAAITNMHGKPMDKTHIFKVSILTDFDKVADTPDVYTEPDASEVPAPAPFLRSWLLDAHVRDQFVIRSTEDGYAETKVYYSDPLRRSDDGGRELVTSGDPETRAAGKTWTDLTVQWSPQGSYLVTFHGPGVAIWGAAQFGRIGRFAHSDVVDISFSPCERYLMTISLPHGPSAPALVNVWNVASGALLRAFNDVTATTINTDGVVNATAPTGPAAQFWAGLKWSHDGRFLARLLPKAISVYETPAMTQLDGKAIPVVGVTDLAWSPVRNTLAYHALEESGHSVVVLMDLPSRRLLAEKHKFEVNSAQLVWQETGRYLASLVTRRKGKKTLAYSVDIFNLSKRGDVPVEEVMLANPGQFAWDPVRPFFATTAAVPAAPGSPVWKCEIAFYRIPDAAAAAAVVAAAPAPAKGKKGAAAAAAAAAAEAAALASVTKRVAAFPLLIPPNHKYDQFTLQWSPAGGHLVSAILAPAPCGIYLFDCSKDDATAVPVMVDALEHDQATVLSWDPSGRYFVTAVTRPTGAGTGSWRDKVEDGYRVWSFQGGIVADATVPRLHQLLWRPRPKTSLTAAQVAEVRATLRPKLWKQFDAEDDDVTRARKSEYTKRRQAIKSAWREFRARCNDRHKADAAERVELRHGAVSDDEADVIEVSVAADDTIARLAL